MSNSHTAHAGRLRVHKGAPLKETKEPAPLKFVYQAGFLYMP